MDAAASRDEAGRSDKRSGDGEDSGGAIAVGAPVRDAR
jgi:hypothetical protein